MGDTISYNPVQLREISDAFIDFKSLFEAAKQSIEEKVTALESSWEGDDSEIAQAEFAKIRTALMAIEENISLGTGLTGVVANKATGFENIKF